jgi:enoyl-CoA hydratase/carnithine racemase
MTADLTIEYQGPLITVQIARPPDNLFTLEMCRQLTAILLSQPKDARALLLTAAGPNFCLGRERTALLYDDIYAMTRELADLNAAIVNSKLIVVAQVSGDAAGFGVGLAALADVSIATSGARFWFPEAEAGLAPALVLTWLPAALGRRLAFWLTATGQPLNADQAQRGSLINQAVPADHLGTAVSEAIELLLRPPSAVSAEIKRDLAAFAALGYHEASDHAVDRLVLRSLVQDGWHRP